MEKRYDGLREFLKNNPVGYDEVFFNLKGEWFFAKNDPFPIEYNRDEVLSDGFESKIEKEIEKRSKKEQYFVETLADTTETLKNKK